MKRLSLLAVSMLLTCTLFAADIFLRGSVNGWGASDDFKFATSDNVVYTLEKSFDLFGEFKFADANWGADNYGSGGGAVELDTPLKLAPGGGNFNCGSNSYKVTKIVLNLLENSATIYGEGGELEITSWTVCGSAAVMGTEFDPTDTSNDMEFVGGVFQLQKKSVALAADAIYEYKFTGNHAWGVGQYPESMDNLEFTVSADGTYNVTFSWNPATKEYGVVPESVTPPTPPVDFDTYILVGDKELFVFDWTPSPMGTDMFTLETTDGIHYTKTVNGVPLNVTGTFAYGFSKNGSTTDIIFKDKSQTVTIEEAATYNITVALTVAPGEEPEAQAELTKVTPGTTYYIAGNGDAETDWCCGASWTANGCPMESGYFTRDLPAGEYKFKITDGTWDNNWGYDAVDAAQSTAGYTSDADGNVVFTLETLSAVAVKFDGSKIALQWTAKDEPVPGFDTWTLVGDMPPFPAAWTVEPAFDLTTTDGVVYTLVADDVDMTVDKFQYGFRKNHTEDFAPLEAKYTATLAEGTGSYKVEITLDFTVATDPKVTVNFTKNVTPTYDYYIAGNGDGLNGWTCGITWVADGCGMAEGQYAAHVQPGTYEFKVTDGTWDKTWGIESVDATKSTPGYEGTDNVKFSVSSEANITVSFDGTSIILLSDVPFGEATITSWTAVGEAGLFENAWTPTDESNDMQFVGGVYQLVKTGLTLEAKDYLYKFTANHTWSVSEIPSGNATLTIAEAGTYKVTFSLNPATGEYNAVPEKEVDPGFDTWTLVGDMPPFPAAWDATMTAFDLQTTDGVVYTLVADDVDMPVAQFQYGFRKNHTDEYAPLEAKYTATLAEGVGNYKVQITLDFTDATNPQVDVQFTKNVTPTYDYYIAGNGWTCDLTWIADGCGMAEGQYKAHVQPGTYEFKVTDGTWDNTWGIESVDATQSTPGYEGTDNVKFSVSSEANITVSFDGTSIILLSDVPFGEATITSWTAVGEAGLFENAWTPTDESNDMQFVGGVYQLVKTGLTLEAKDYLYKFTANHTWNVSEIPSGNATLTIAEAGTYKVTFSLNPATGEYNAVPEKETPTSADEAVEDSIYATSGTVYCSTPFEVYNLVGQNVTAQNGSLFGIYIVKTANTVKTVSVK